MSAATWRFHANLRSDMHVAALDMFPLARPLRGSDTLNEVQSVQMSKIRIAAFVQYAGPGFRDFGFKAYKYESIYIYIYRV